MASGSGIPFNTLRGYFSGKRPGGENAKKLADATGLDLKLDSEPMSAVKDGRPTDNTKKRAYAARLLEDLQYDLSKCLESIVPAREALLDGICEPGGSIRRKAQLVQALLDALQRNLEVFIGNQDALRQLRQIVSGSDAGYLSGLLVAIFDDRRLQTWKEMTTYKYGSR
jgi:hypothetical protein